MHLSRLSICIVFISTALVLGMVGCTNDTPSPANQPNQSDIPGGVSPASNNADGIAVITGKDAKNISLDLFQQLSLHDLQPLLDNYDNSNLPSLLWDTIAPLGINEIGVAAALNKLQPHFKSNETFAMEVGNQTFPLSDTADLVIENLDLYVSGGIDTLTDLIQYMYADGGTTSKTLTVKFSAKTKISDTCTSDAKKYPSYITDSIYVDLQLTDFSINPSDYTLSGRISLDIRYSLAMNYTFDTVNEIIAAPMVLEFTMTPIIDFDLSRIPGSFFRDQIGLKVFEENPNFDEELIWNTLKPLLWGDTSETCLSLYRTIGNAEGRIKYMMISEDHWPLKELLLKLSKVYKTFLTP